MFLVKPILDLYIYDYQAMQAAGQIAQTIEVPAAALTLTTNIPFAGSAISRQARRLYVGKLMPNKAYVWYKSKYLLLSSSLSI